jgi:uncharacterized Fe-S cluster protein YjdI
MGHPITKRYSNGEITVVWKPDLCHHSGICARGLPLVFDPRRRPWVMVQHADSQTIVEQVARCPSAALSIERDTGTTDTAGATGKTGSK